MATFQATPQRRHIHHPTIGGPGREFGEPWTKLCLGPEALWYRAGRVRGQAYVLTALVLSFLHCWSRKHIFYHHLQSTWFPDEETEADKAGRQGLLVIAVSLRGRGLVERAGPWLSISTP